MELDYKALGKRIKIARINADMTQDRLSTMLEMSPSHMSNIETGSTRISLTALVSIANALGVTVDDLLCDSLVYAKTALERDAAGILSDCTHQELKIITGTMRALKENLRKAAENTAI